MGAGDIDLPVHDLYPGTVTQNPQDPPASAAHSGIRMRGRSFIAVALTPETPVAEWLAALDAQIARAPGFFAGKPVVLDLSAAPLHAPGLRAFLGELRQRHIRVLGLEGVGPELAETIPDLPPVLSSGRPGGFIETVDDVAERMQAEEAGRKAALPDLQADGAEEPASLLIATPVRSGQSIQFLRGDVTVVGSVSSGAEIVAGGSIHIYGTLRGRAFAGMSGDTGARIFCRRLDAELLAVAGSYATADGIGPDLRGKPVQAWFDGQTIALAALD